MEVVSMMGLPGDSDWPSVSISVASGKVIVSRLSIWSDVCSETKSSALYSTWSKWASQKAVTMSPSGSVVNTEYLWIIDNTSCVSSSFIPSVNSSHLIPSRKRVKGRVPSSDVPLWTSTPWQITRSFSISILISPYWRMWTTSISWSCMMELVLMLWPSGYKDTFLHVSER